MSINRDDIFRIVIAVVLSLLAFIGNEIRSEQIDINCRLRTVELNQARIMERMGIQNIASSVEKQTYSGSVQ